MAATPAHPPNDKLVGFFCRHVLPIYVSLTGPGGSIQRMYSSFVLSVCDQWLLITAGHCIEEVQDALDAGYKIERCRLIDCMGNNANHLFPVPFEFNKNTAVKLCENSDFDYGVLFLDDNTVSLLKANGITPLTEETWATPPQSADAYKMVGIPIELSDTDERYARPTAIIHDVHALQEKPSYFDETDAPTFYAKIQLGEPLTTIKGMSGGPIFAFKRVNGEIKYWLYAVQSRWMKNERTIAACLMEPLGTFIKEIMEGKHCDLIEENHEVTG